MWEAAAKQFKFQVGDEVVHRTNAGDKDRRVARFVITSRSLDQCHGGIQRSYVCATMVIPEYGREVMTAWNVRLSEDELAAAPGPKLAAAA